MTKAFDQMSPCASATDGSAWNLRTFGELVEIIGAHEANRIATHFRSDLRTRFVNVMNREVVQRDAHAVRSTAEVLGFAELSEAASLLEAACENGVAFDRSLQTLLSAKVRANNALGNCIAPSPTGM